MAFGDPHNKPGQTVSGPSLRHDLYSGDLGAMLRLHGTLYSQERGYDLTFEGYVARTLGHFARPYDPARERVWLAESGDELVGCIGLVHFSEMEAQIRWFLVAPPFRGCGLGRALLSEAVQFARAAGYRSVFLETVSELTAAAHLYRAIGFVKTSETDMELWGQRVTEERYELEIIV